MNNVKILSNDVVFNKYQDLKNLEISEVKTYNEQFPYIWELKMPIISKNSWDNEADINPKYLPNYKGLIPPNKNAQVLNISKNPDNKYLFESLISVIVDTESFDGLNNKNRFDITNDIKIDYEKTLDKNKISREELDECVELIIDDDERKYFKFKKPFLYDIIVKVDGKYENQNSLKSFIRYEETYFIFKFNITPAPSAYTGFCQLCNHNIPYIKQLSSSEKNLNIKDIISTDNFDIKNPNTYQTRSTGNFNITEIKDFVGKPLNINNIEKDNFYYIHGTQSGDTYYSDLPNCILIIKFI